jgi:hypothetical protein
VAASLTHFRISAMIRHSGEIYLVLIGFPRHTPLGTEIDDEVVLSHISPAAEKFNV